MMEHVLIVDFDRARRERWQELLSEYGFRVTVQADRAGALQAAERLGAKTILIGDCLPEADLPAFVRSFKRHSRRAAVMVLTDRPAVIESLRGIAEGFIGSTLPPFALEALIRGACERTTLRRRLHRQTTRFERRLETKLRERVENERFLAVKQIVDKLSSFIGRISRDVEGGVRYFNAMPYFVSIHDRSARVLAANRPYRSLLGGKAGTGSWRVFEGASAAPESCPVAQTIRTADARESREVVRYRSGAKVPVIVHTAPIYNNEGEVELVLEVAAGTQDVARLQEDTSQAQQRYQLIFDAVPCYVVVLDRGLHVSANNRAFVNEFGDRVGAHFTEVFPMNPSELAASPIEETLRKGVARHGEMVLVRPGEKRAHMLVWASPMATAAGKLMQVLVILLDISQVRELQTSLASLGLMIGSIAHSIKGVLTGLDAGVYLLTRGVARKDEAQVESGLETVQRMAERIRRMVFDILLFAKERKVRRVPVALRAFAEELLDLVRPQFEAKGVPIELDCPPDPGGLEADADLLRPALVNLLENAADACAAQATAREPRVVLRIAADEARVVFTVEDNGVGMNPEQLQNLFTLFFSTKGTQGTGLGLFITDSIVRRHGGRIEVESTPGLGSRFRVSLPRRVDAAPPAPAGNKGQDAGEPPPPGEAVGRSAE